MNYETYKLQRKLGTVVAGIDTSVALRLMDYLPKRFQYAHMFWSWIWILSIPTAIALSIFYRLWVGGAILFFVTPIIFSATKKSAAQFVLEHAENDQVFFDKLVERNLLTFRQKDR